MMVYIWRTHNNREMSNILPNGIRNRLNNCWYVTDTYLSIYVCAEGYLNGLGCGTLYYATLKNCDVETHIKDSIMCRDVRHTYLNV